MSARRRSERGVSLVETVVAVGILGSAIVAFLAGISTGVLSTSQSDRLSTAHELARAQLEYTKASPYQAAPAAYATVTPVSGYGVTSTASTIAGGDAKVELITVQVTKDGATVFSLEGYKVDR